MKKTFGKQRCFTTRKINYFSLSLRSLNYAKYLKSNAQVALSMGAETCLSPHVKLSLLLTSENNLTELNNFSKTY